MPCGADISTVLQKIFEHNNFSVHLKSYSRYSTTEHFLSALSNYKETHGEIELAKNSSNGEKGILGQNKYFSDLKKIGYSLNIYQTNVFDLCAATEVSSCTEYNVTKASALRYIDSPILLKFWILYNVFSRPSMFLKILDSYSTIFAIKGPEIEPGYDSEMRNITGLVSQHFLIKERNTDKYIQEVFLYGDTKEKPARIVPLPNF